MDRLVKADVKEIEMSFKSGQKCSVIFRLTNLMHTMSVAVSLTTANPNDFSFLQPLAIIPPLSSLPFTLLLSQPSDQPPLRSPRDSVTVRSAMLPTGKAHQDDLRRLFSVPGRHVFHDAVIPISLVGPQVVEFLVASHKPGERSSASSSSSLARALSGCAASQIPRLFALAVRSGSADLVSAMINAGAADVDGRDPGGDSMLCVAVELGNIETVKLLIASGCGIDGEALRGAARVNRAGLVEILVKSFPDTDVDSRDSDGMTPTHIAASHGHVETLEFLLSVGADGDAADGRGWTPLHHASANGHAAAVEILLGRSNGKYAVDGEGKTAFGLAAERGHAELLPGLRLNDALHRAARVGDAGGVRGCLAEGAAVDGRDQWGWTPLHRAALKGRVECARVLLGRGAEVDAADHAGYTPLRCAVEAGHAPLAALLVANGARVGTKSLKALVAASDSLAVPRERARLKATC